MPDDRGCRATRGVGFELRGRARFLQGRQTRRKLFGQFDFDAGDVGLAADRSRRIGDLRVEAGAIRSARLPEVETVNCGLNARLWQPPTAKLLETSVFAFSEPDTIAVTCWLPGSPGAPQLVGLNMKPGRSISTVTRFRRRGTPSRICGSAYGPVSSVVTVSVESAGFDVDTRSDDHQAEVERARDRRRHDAEPERRAVVRARQVYRAFDFEGVRARRQTPRGWCRSSRLRGSGPRRPAVLRRAGRRRASPAAPGGVHLDALDELFAVLAREVNVNALYCPACGVTVPATNPGCNSVGWRATFHLKKRRRTSHPASPRQRRLRG